MVPLLRPLLRPFRDRPWRFALPALAVVVIADDLLVRYEPSRVIVGLLDESAHLATASLLVAALPLPRGDPFLLGALAGAVLIDADHLPGEFGWPIITRGSGRPLPHSLPTVGLLLAITTLARGPWRAVMAGATYGLMTHLLRDGATGGMPLWWPRSKRRVRIPYDLYLLLLTGASLALVRGAHHPDRSPPPVR